LRVTSRSEERSGVRVLRRDAAENQQRIIEAARVVFAEQGVDVALAEVAKEAGVGLATLSRRFDRFRLVEAVILDSVAEHLRFLEQALELPPWEGLTGYLRALCERQLADRNICHSITLELPTSPEIAQIRAVIQKDQQTLIRRAQRSGELRKDVVPQDLVLILEAMNGVISSTKEAAPDSWKRMFILMTDSLRPAAVTSALPKPPTFGQMMVAIHAPSRGRRTSAIVAS
jgi:AcrR family transcriptional regulator